MEQVSEYKIEELLKCLTENLTQLTNAKYNANSFLEKMLKLLNDGNSYDLRTGGNVDLLMRIDTRLYHGINIESQISIDTSITNDCTQLVLMYLDNLDALIKICNKDYGVGIRGASLYVFKKTNHETSEK